MPPQVLRSIRVWAPRLAKQLEALELGKAQLGLAHSYSRAKVKFNVNRVDNMIIQARAGLAGLRLLPPACSTVATHALKQRAR